ncbi:hypothetical protein AWB81_08585 [Caballeronia arationis]|nr:hypothetical protein AWB81_08585 [Caballeronia arationis]
MVLIAPRGCGAHDLVNEIDGRRWPYSSDHAHLEDRFRGPVLARHDVLRINEVRIHQRDPERPDVLGDKRDLRQAGHDDIGTLRDEVLACLAQQFDRPATQIAALHAVWSIDGFSDEVDAFGCARMNHFELGRREILFEEAFAPRIAGRQHADTANGRKLPSYMAADRLDHVDDLQWRVGL